MVSSRQNLTTTINGHSKEKRSDVGTGVKPVARVLREHVDAGETEKMSEGEEYRAVPEQWFRSAGIAVLAQPYIFVLQLLRCFPRRAPYLRLVAKAEETARRMRFDKIVSVFVSLGRLGRLDVSLSVVFSFTPRRYFPPVGVI